jgi:hypothetical protein
VNRVSELRIEGGDRGSTVPLILGLFLIALLLVAGSVAAGDAFVQQDQLQDLCDGAAVAAASAANLSGDRGNQSSDSQFLTLGSVQSAVNNYLAHDPARAGVTTQASLSADATEVAVRCSQTRTIAFGAVFGYGNGVVHTATSPANGRRND